MRSDLPIGFAAAQIVHAAGESSPGNLSTGTNAVVLSVDSECSLYLLLRKLQRAGVELVAVHEPDPPWNGQLTAIGLAPVSDRSLVKPILSGLSLFGKNQLRVAV